MRVDITPLPDSEVTLSIALSWEEWKKDVDKAVLTLGKSVKVEGFRAGKVPREVLERKIGKGALLAEAADSAIRRSYATLLRQNDIEAIGRPEVTLNEHEEGGEFRYTVKTARMPEVTLESWEEKIREVNRKQANETEGVTESEVDEALQKIAESRAKFVTVPREARTGDGVEIDFLVLQEGVPIENGTSKGHHLILGKGTFIPGFEEAILGMQAGEEKQFNLSFPLEYHAKHLAGKPARFEVKLKAVEERTIPEIDDAFAASLGAFETAEALRASVRGGLEKEKKEAQKESWRGEMIEAIVSVTHAELPAVLVSEERGKMLAEFELQLSEINTTLEEFLEKSKKTREELEAQWTGQAKKRVLSALALEKIAKDRDIEPTHEEVEAEMNRALRYYRTVRQAEKDIDLGRLHAYSAGRLRNEKVFEYLEGIR
ncbi:MAG: trigger factor [Candidatus Moraniibacteriota bacterium]|nr:MAG: trigger factor [Candidatus Moranbacteria bacterium]